MSENKTRKVLILLLVCVLLVLGGCSSNKSQDQAKDCSASQINELSKYYDQQADKVLYIINEVGPDDPSGAYRQSSELFAEASNYDHPACANTVHSHFLNALDKMTEGYRLAWDGKTSEAADAMESSNEEVLKFREEFEKLKK